MSLGGFVHFHIWNRRIACRKSCCRFLPSATQEQVPASRLPSTHCHTAYRNAGMPSAMLGSDRQMTSLTQLIRRPGQMVGKYCLDDVTIEQKVPVRVSETKQVKITQACFKSLTAADLSPKDDFDQLFNFQGPVISECTIITNALDLYSVTRLKPIKQKKLIQEKQFLET